MISRRGFLKGTATAAGAGLMGGGLLADNLTLDKIEKIPHATHFGPFYGVVRDGVLEDIIPQSSDANPSVLVRGIVDRTYSNTRVKFPFVRKSYLAKTKGHERLRGREEFVRVSWDMALDLVYKKLKEIPNKEIFNASYGGWGHVGRLHNSNGVAGRFFNTTIGGAIGTDGEYSNGAAGKTVPTIMGDLEVYSHQTVHEQMIANTKVYVLWGADLFKCNRIDYVVPNHVNDLYYPEYKKSGMKFISIDPIYTDTAEAFNAEWIKIRPNTDVALALGMMHHLYTTKKYDKDFVEKYTFGFDRFLPYLLGQTDKVPKTPEWASKITEVSASKIKELADLMVSTRSFIAGNWACQRAQYGEQADFALITLASMIGQIGTAGGGIGFSMHYSGGGQARADHNSPGGLAQGRNRVGIDLPASRISEAILNPGKTIKFKGQEMVYPKIKMMHCCGASVLGHHPNTNELIRAMRTLDTVVVHEPWWTPFAKMADIVLPATSTLERNDITGGGSYSRNMVYAMKQVIAPIHESKDDYEIFRELAKKFGDKVEGRYTNDKTQMQWIEEFYNKSDAPEIKDFATFWKDGFLEFPIDKSARSFVRHKEFRDDPVGNKLATETGKIQIFSEKFDSYQLPDFKGHCYWFEPSEYLGDAKKTKKHPFHLLSPHPKYRIHSQLDNTWVRDVYKIQGREPIMINTNDAKKLGIAHKEVVEVYNDRGRLLAGAFVTDNIREGVVAISEGAWYAPEASKDEYPRCNGGHVNVLTSSVPTSQMAQAVAANTCLVAIKKVDKESLAPNQAASLPKTIGA